ncbi:hypothetical protein FQZ97_1180650 [compost metagenome]
MRRSPTPRSPILSDDPLSVVQVETCPLAAAPLTVTRPSLPAFTPAVPLLLRTLPPPSMRSVPLPELPT